MKRKNQTPEERVGNGQHRKINTMITSLVQNIDEGWMTIEELKFVVKSVEFKLKERKRNEKNNVKKVS